MHTRYPIWAACALAPLSVAAAPSPPQAYPTIHPVPVANLSANAATDLSPVLTLEQAIERALATHPQVRVAALEVDIADGAVAQASLRPNPALTYGAEGTRRGNRTHTTELSQTFELGGKRPARIALAEQDRALARQDLAQARHALRATVTAAYCNALVAAERRELAWLSVQLADKAAATTARRVAAGKISPVEHTRSTVAAATARIAANEADTGLALARRKLSALLGDPSTLHAPLAEPSTDAITMPSTGELAASLDQLPQLRRAQLAVARASASLRLETAQRVPDVTLSVGRKRDASTGRTQTTLGLSVPLPLVDRNQGNIATALRRVDQAQAALTAERLQAEQATAEAGLRLRAAASQADSLRSDILPAAQRAYDAAVTGFELGKFNFLDVLDAQRTLIQSREQYLAAVQVRYQALADLLGVLPPGAAVTQMRETPMHQTEGSRQ